MAAQVGLTASCLAPLPMHETVLFAHGHALGAAAVAFPLLGLGGGCAGGRWASHPRWPAGSIRQGCCKNLRRGGVHRCAQMYTGMSRYTWVYINVIPPEPALPLGPIFKPLSHADFQVTPGHTQCTAWHS